MTQAARATGARSGRREGDATMRKSLGTARALRVGLISVALGALIAVGYALSSAGEAAAQNRRGQPQLRMFSGVRDCTRAPREMRDLDDGAYNGSAIRTAATCADSARGGAEQIAYANFLAGKARRILGERNEPCPPRPSSAGRSCLQDAEQLFSAARGSADPAVANRAWLERARVLRLLGNFAAAKTELTNLNSQEPPAQYEQAMVILDALAADDRQNLGREQSAANRQNSRMDALRFLQTGFSVPVTAPEYAYVQTRGPLQLARLANDMGKEDLESQSPERVSLAEGRFRVAQAAVSFLSNDGRQNPLAAEINFNAGRVQLRLAALRATPPREECQPTPERATRLDTGAAEHAFRTALDKGSRDANWGIGCVLLIRGGANDFEDAVRSFTLAIPPENASSVLPRSEYYVGLARAQASKGDLGNAGEPEGAETSGALGSFRRALGAEGDSSRTQRIRLELGDVYARMGRAGMGPDLDRRALRIYTELLSQSNAPPDVLAEAYYQRGLLYDRAGQLNNAVEDLTRASSYNTYQRRAAASYKLSDLLARRCGQGAQLRCSRATAQAAYGAADQAVQSAADGDETNRTLYKRQACLLRIRLGYTWDQGQAACTNVQNGPPGALYEGMFWLAYADSLTAWRQQNAWSQANQAFKRGADALSAAGQDLTLDEPGNLSMRDLLSYGQRIVLFCLGGGGADNAPAPPGVADYFLGHGVPMCTGAR